VDANLSSPSPDLGAGRSLSARWGKEVAPRGGERPLTSRKWFPTLGVTPDTGSSSGFVSETVGLQHVHSDVQIDMHVDRCAVRARHR
jgi:hypothetical protein